MENGFFFFSLSRGIRHQDWSRESIDYNISSVTLSQSYSWVQGTRALPLFKQQMDLIEAPLKQTRATQLCKFITQKVEYTAPNCFFCLQKDRICWTMPSEIRGVGAVAEVWKLLMQVRLSLQILYIWRKEMDNLWHQQASAWRATHEVWYHKGGSDFRQSSRCIQIFYKISRHISFCFCTSLEIWFSLHRWWHVPL